MIEVLAFTVVVLTGFYFIALGAVSLFMPAQANRFLFGFAGSALTHYTELSLRFVVGAAFIRHAPFMRLAGVFTLFGWVLLVTTACLLLLPWRWHHRIAHQTVPRATRYITLIGLASVVMGGFILAAVIRGGTV